MADTKRCDFEPAVLNGIGDAHRDGIGAHLKQRCDRHWQDHLGDDTARVVVDATLRLPFTAPVPDRLSVEPHPDPIVRLQIKAQVRRQSGEFEGRYVDAVSSYGDAPVRNRDAAESGPIEGSFHPIDGSSQK